MDRQKFHMLIQLTKNIQPGGQNMNTLVRVTAFGFILAASLLTSSLSQAQTASTPAPISILFTGLGDDMAVGQATALSNPANCSLHDAADLTSATTGYKTFLATALTAITTGQNITIVISNTACSNARPMLIGLNINP
jgi:hypothetical protein